MKIIIQRSLEASVTVKNKKISSINKGLVLLIGFTQNDNIEKINKAINKIINLRIFDDENHIMNKSVLDIKGEILSISQFTLYGDISKGRRPNYSKALNFKEAKQLYNLFNQNLKKIIKVKEGIFGENMQINLINDGPVTIILDI